MAFLKARAPQIDDTPKAEVLADFRQAWQEAMTGQGMGASHLIERIKSLWIRSKNDFKNYSS